MTNIGKFYVYRDEDGNAVAVAKRAKGPSGGVVGIDFCKMGVPYGSTTREDINNRAEFIAAALNTFLNTSVALAAKDAEIERLKAALVRLESAASDFYDSATTYFSDTTFDADGVLANAHAELSVVALPDARSVIKELSDAP